MAVLRGIWEVTFIVLVLRKNSGSFLQVRRYHAVIAEGLACRIKIVEETNGFWTLHDIRTPFRIAAGILACVGVDMEPIDSSRSVPGEASKKRTFNSIVVVPNKKWIFLFDGFARAFQRRLRICLGRYATTIQRIFASDRVHLADHPDRIVRYLRKNRQAPKY